jgi:hypothetical protein
MGKNKYEKFGERNFGITTGTVGNSEGDIIWIGDTEVTAGKVYYLTEGEEGGDEWALADADAELTSKNLLAVARGTGVASTVGMLVRGVVTLADDPGTGVGLPMFLSVTAGTLNRTAPTAAGDVVRVAGYQLVDGGKVFFNPDATYILLA